jgi:hypothetical protein
MILLADITTERGIRMPQSLLKDVTVNELMELRHSEGLSNQEIADRLGVHVTTIYHYIGRQPKELRKVRISGVVYPPSFKTETKPEEEPVSALLVVTNRSVNVVGADNEYSIDYAEQRIRMRRRNDGKFYWDLSFEEIGNVASELSAIAKKVQNFKITPEMW